ncbi:nitroreductase family protein [Lutibacter sp. HS1-25]|uniref:nitroreductase family protein n=1 Tax=Lutibacter sp. HS1-25 TaxID=2485000 RepID=UPI001011C918|nr:nitroreductase family protein [Lutibacter sp. HS1-25]RXP60333.1 nitroreductase family protein [Lutibacter sp. HS1-25]
MEINTSLIDAINYRRSVRIYDETKEIDAEIVKKCIDQATLSPSSSNMQLWEFHHIVSSKILNQLSIACLDQSAAKTAKQLVVIVVRKDLWKQRTKANAAYLKNSFGNKPESEYSSREQFALNYYQKLLPFIYADFLGIFGAIKYIIGWVIGLFKPSYRQLSNADMRIVAHKSAGLAAQTFMLSMAAKNYDTCPMEGIDTLRIKKILNLPTSSEINMVISCGIRKPEGVYGDRFRIPFESVYKQW